MGRVDLIINSGGVKLQIEELEEALSLLVPKQFKGSICVWKKRDDLLGEMVVCISDSQELLHYFQKNTTHLKSSFIKYGWPKRWHYISQLIQTESGKTNRIESFLGSKALSI